MELAPGVEIKRAGSRRYERLDWLHAWHSFSGATYKPGTDSHFGVLVNHDHGIVSPNCGFDTHYHRNMEIVTWVLEGSLVHKDTQGHSGIIYPDLAQRMTAGRGIFHSERNDSWTLEGPRHADDVDLVQMWVLPDEAGADPSYEQLEVGAELAGNDLVLIASGMRRNADDAAIRIRNRFAAMHVARLQTGHSVELPPAPYVHLYVARGSVDVEGVGVLDYADALRSTVEFGRRVTAVADAEIIVWEMHTTVAA